MKRTAKILKILTGILVSCFFLVLAFRRVSLTEFWISLEQVRLSALTLSVLFFGLSCLFRVLMWRVTSRRLGKASFNKLFGGVVIGYLANNFLPLRAGEVIRGDYLSAASGIPVVALFSTVFIERAFDMFFLSLLLLLALCSGIMGIKWPVADKLLFLFGMLAFLIIFLIAAIKFAERLEKQKVNSKLLGILLRNIREFIQPLDQLRLPQVLILLASFSLGAWISNYFSILVLLENEGGFLFKAALLVLLFVNVGMLIPSSPGALGVMQAAFWLALAPFGVAKEESLALSFAYQGGLYFFTLVVGLPYLFTYRFRRLSRY